jgi:hypothetical protein
VDITIIIPQMGNFPLIWDWLKRLVNSYWTGRMIAEWNSSRPGTNHLFALIGLEVGIPVPASGELVWNYYAGHIQNIY